MRTRPARRTSPTDAGGQTAGSPPPTGEQSRVRWIVGLCLAATVLVALPASAATLKLRGGGPAFATSESAVRETPRPKAPTGLDHFKCYTVATQRIRQRVATLQDQFGTSRTRVRQVKQLCNPVRKTHGRVVTQIRRSRAHLTCRRTFDAKRTKGLPRAVRLVNQFGVVETRATRAQTLCLPSLKRIVRGKTRAPKGSNPEKVLDHFRCYDVEPRRVKISVALRDQFARTSTTVTRLVSLCNPVRKRFNRRVSRIKRAQAHLACYTIKDRQRFRRRSVIVRNQFGTSRLRVTKVASLCLPTTKILLPTTSRVPPRKG